MRRVNLLGNLNVSPVVQIPGTCQNPCTNPADLNLVPGDANGFVIANSVITGRVIDTNGLNPPGWRATGATPTSTSSRTTIGGYSGFGSDMVFNGILGAPATTSARRQGHRTAPRASRRATSPPSTRVPVVREEPYVYYDNGQFFVFSPSVQFDVPGL